MGSMVQLTDQQISEMESVTMKKMLLHDMAMLKGTNVTNQSVNFSKENCENCLCGNYKFLSDCYYDIEKAGKCRKLLCHNGSKTIRVILHPEEGWAKSAPGIQWRIKVNRLVLMIINQYFIIGYISSYFVTFFIFPLREASLGVTTIAFVT